MSFIETLHREAQLAFAQAVNEHQRSREAAVFAGVLSKINTLVDKYKLSQITVVMPLESRTAQVFAAASKKLRPDVPLRRVAKLDKSLAKDGSVLVLTGASNRLDIN